MTTEAEQAGIEALKSGEDTISTTAMKFPVGDKQFVVDTSIAPPTGAMSGEGQGGSFQPLTLDEAKAALRSLEEMLAKGWYSDAHRYVKDILQDSSLLGRQAPLAPYLGGFDVAFRTACRKNSILASYVALEPYVDTGTNKSMYRIYVGGHHVADNFLSTYLQPLRTALGEPLGPKKTWADVGDIVKRPTFTDVK